MFSTEQILIIFLLRYMDEVYQIYIYQHSSDLFFLKQLDNKTKKQLLNINQNYTNKMEQNRLTEQIYDNIFCTKCFNMINHLIFQLHSSGCSRKYDYQQKLNQNNNSNQNISNNPKILQSKLFKKEQFYQDQLPIICSNCGQYITFQQLDQHPKQCRYPAIKCQYCDRDYSFDLIEQHYQICMGKSELQKLRNEYRLHEEKQEKQMIEILKKIDIQQLKRNEAPKKINQSINYNNMGQYYEQKSQLKDKGMTLTQIKLLKQISYNKKKQQQMCSICYNPFKNHQKLIHFKCKHTFHAECVKVWLKQSRKCPVCKREVL